MNDNKNDYNELFLDDNVLYNQMNIKETYSEDYNLASKNRKQKKNNTKLIAYLSTIIVVLMASLFNAFSGIKIKLENYSTTPTTISTSFSLNYNNDDEIEFRLYNDNLGYNESYKIESDSFEKEFNGLIPNTTYIIEIKDKKLDVVIFTKEIVTESE